MSVPESIWIAGMLDECGSYYSEPVEAEGECGGIAVEYIRADLVDPAAIRAAALREAVEAAFHEGFLAGTADGWVNNPRIKMEWKRSRALAELKGGKDA